MIFHSTFLEFWLFKGVPQKYLVILENLDCFGIFLVVDAWDMIN